ncbi:MAG: hypothetical protein F4Z88_05975, partial [Chloroflexi bacterium]|nr:hypothetical protein [Chloroflexota bacterium]
PWTAFGPGWWRVDVDVVPGVYVSENLTGNCEWLRAHNIRAREGEIIGSGSASSGVLRVAVLPTDAAIITSTGCGTWTLETPSSNPPPRDSTFSRRNQPTTLSSSGDHTCALRPDMTVVCWGSDVYEQSSPEKLKDENDDPLPPEELLFTSISAGSFNTCGLRPDLTLLCWGDDSEGQSTPRVRTTPGIGDFFIGLDVGALHGCAIRRDFAPVCWGSNGPELAGVPTPTPASTDPDYWDGLKRADPPPNERFDVISSGGQHTCALRRDGSAVCWGDARYGQTTPPEGGKYTAISAGGLHTCAIDTDGAAVCWGSNEMRQASPPQGVNFSAISSGIRHTCALRSDGAAVCWGSDAQGQSSPPDPDARYAAISSGGVHTCALEVDGTAVCWGRDAYGQASPPEDERFAVGRTGAVMADPMR